MNRENDLLLGGADDADDVGNNESAKKGPTRSEA